MVMRDPLMGVRVETGVAVGANTRYTIGDQLQGDRQVSIPVQKNCS